MRNPFLIGIIHGLAGSGALMLVVLSTVSSPLQGMMYTLSFGLGSTIGTLMISLVISLPFIWADNRSSDINRLMSLACGTASVFIGPAL